jgi:DNA repair exonuclease SbcCD ATPase subunit
MADVNIASFDLDAAGALRAVSQLSDSIKGLEKELAQLQKEGKDTTAVQQKLAAATASLDKVLKQETTTARGASAQVKALSVVTKDLAVSQEKANKSGKSFGASLGRNAVSFKSFAGGLARGGTALANLAGGLGLAGGALTLVSVATEKLIEGFISLFAESKSVAEAKQGIADASEEAIGAFVEEIGTSKALFSVLKDGNATQAQRLKAIEQLNEKYPTALKNINLLTGGEEALAAAQKAVNAEIINNIILQARQNVTAQIIQKQLENNNKILATRRKLAEDAANEEVTLFDKIADAAISTAAASSTVARAASDALPDAQTIRKTATALSDLNAIANLEQDNVALTNSLRDLDVASAELRQTLEASVDLVPANQVVLADLNKEVDKGAKSAKDNAAEQKALEGSLAALRAEQSRLNKAIEEGTKLNNEEELKRLSVEYANVSKSIADAEKKLALFRGETGVAANSLSALRQAASEIRKTLEEQTNVDDIAKLQALQAQYQELETKIKEVEDSLKSLDAVEVEPKGVLDADLDAAKAALSQLQAQQAAANVVLQQEQNKALELTRNNAAAQAIVREKFAKQAQEAETAQRLATLRLQSQIAQAELNLATEASGVLSEEALKAKTDLLEIQKEIAKIEGEEFTAKVTVETDTEDLKKVLEEVAGFAEQLAGQVLDFAASQVDNTLNQLEGAIGKQEELLDKLLSNEEGANAERVRLEKERLDNLNKAREEAKNKEAQIAQAQIAINLALAVARAVAEGGGVASALTVAAAIAAAIFGFIQAKQTAQQAFYEGSLYVDDPRAPQGRDTIQARLNRGEAVIPTDTNARYKKAIHGIYHERVPAQLANDFFANNSQWVEAMQAYKQGLISPQIQAVPVPVSAGAGAGAGIGDALPLSAALGYVGRTISEQPRNVLRGKDLVTIVKNGSSKLDKIRNKSKGKNR